MKLLQSLLEAKQTAWVILFTPDRLILGKRAPDVNNGNQWNFFGGTIDAGETPKQAAVRELKEEAKVSVDESALKLIAEINGAHYFSCKIADAGMPSRTKEISRVKGYKLTDLPDNLHAKTQNFFDKLETFL